MRVGVGTDVDVWISTTTNIRGTKLTVFGTIFNFFLFSWNIESGKSYQKQHSAREICTPLMFVAYVK